MGSINLAVIAGAPGALMTLRPAIDQHLREAIMNSPLMRGRGGRQ
jgi:hypothetical protein